MLSNQSADDIKTDNKNEAAPSGYTWDDDAELEKLALEITKDRKPCPRPKIRIHIPKNLKLPSRIGAASLIDLHNMSLPVFQVYEDAKIHIFDATNRTIGQPFSREREGEAIEIAQKMAPCAFCLATKQAENAAYKHTYLDKNGEVSCYLVLDFVNRIHNKQQNTKNSLRATMSKEDIELVLRKTLEAKNKESLRLTWPMTSVSSKLNNIDLNNINKASVDFKKSPLKINQYNTFNFSTAEKNENLSIQQTELSIPSLMTQSNKPELGCSVENPFKVVKYQPDAEVSSKTNFILDQILSKSTLVPDLRNFVTSPPKLNQSKSSFNEYTEENKLNNTIASKSETTESEVQSSSEEDYIPNFNDDLFSIPNSGVNIAYLHSSPIREKNLPLNFCDNFTEYSQISDDAYDEITYANHFSHPGIFSF